MVTRAPSRILPRTLLMWLPLLLLGGCLGAFFGIAKPQTIWLPTNDVFTAASGTLFALTLLLLAIAAAAVAYYSTATTTRKRDKNSINAEESTSLVDALPQGQGQGQRGKATPTIYPSRASDNVPTVGLLLLFLALQVFVTACFSAVWNYSFHSYASAPSPYSLVDK